MDFGQARLIICGQPLLGWTCTPIAHKPARALQIDHPTRTLLQPKNETCDGSAGQEHALCGEVTCTTDIAQCSLLLSQMPASLFIHGIQHQCSSLPDPMSCSSLRRQLHRQAVVGGDACGAQRACACQSLVHWAHVHPRRRHMPQFRQHTNARKGGVYFAWRRVCQATCIGVPLTALEPKPEHNHAIVRGRANPRCVSALG